ncbi:DUF2750 domain-containing protein [Paraglaciecola aquimarina]|uniref:DUF2750 domain-containing protein n=1 Tax=Paraglaciecola aquimarina TaxID=1235557 RepID=A0ABU3SV39_9ALTE|nr:DUF2750 domain-containing protein [Paraglaciecola aquimarina]MDU0353881.1 DUF2750 domain-containing protein [Paraglaciecola aquimarina]
MTDIIDTKTIAQYTPEQRLRYLLQEIVQHKQIWILIDDDGCVMLNTEDEDCAPVWPSEAYAQAWATGEWADCQPKAIDLKTWHAKWTQGLEDDDVAIAVFPSEDEEGLVISAQELDFEIRTKSKSNH